MYRMIIVLLVALSLSGCIAAPVKTGEYSSADGRNELAELLFKNAQKCWSQKQSLFGDAIVVENKIELRGAVITARRSASDIGYQEPFMIVIVNDKSGTSKVEVQEGDYALGMRKEFTPDVNRWINGDSTCKPKST